jgi:hypothetical protein
MIVALDDKDFKDVILALFFGEGRWLAYPAFAHTVHVNFRDIVLLLY